MTEEATKQEELDESAGEATADAGGSDGAGAGADDDEAAAGDPQDAAGEVEDLVTDPGEGLAGTREELEEKLAELEDRHLRLAAEFNNYRRRQETALTQAWGRAQAELLGRFLDVLDDLQRVSALELADEAVTAESIVEGIDLVERKFVRTLEESGAEVVDPVEGDAFDPERMEAMMRVPDESGERDDQVAQVLQKGYVLKGNLVRPARVSVYKG